MRFLVVAALGLVCVVAGVQAAVARPRPARVPPLAQTTNWAGYVVRSHSLLTRVTGRFTVPRLNCARTPEGGAATWVGIGGVGKGAGPLIQTGVQTVCVGGAQTVNSGWWELYPPYAQIFFRAMTVSPGDRIEASVRRLADGHTWLTRVDDLSTGISGSLRTGDGWGTVSDSSPGSWLSQDGSTPGLAYGGGHTAEWIEEDYGDALSSSLSALADFRKVRFTKLTTSLRSWSLVHGKRMGIAQGGVVLAVPSPPDASGHGFSVVYRGSG